MPRPRKSKAAPKPIEPVEESREAFETGSAGSEYMSHAADKAMSKSAAARAALAQGIASPRKASAFILEQYGIEMTPQHFSAVKSQLKKEPPAGSRMRGVDGYLAPPPHSSAEGGADVLETLEALKPLIAQYGGDKVKRMIDLLG